jgi:hypothetical protein
MRLVKLLAYCALGYVVYEFVQGMRHGSAEQWTRRPQGGEWPAESSRSPWSSGSTGSAGSAGSAADLRRALNEDAGRMNVTGSGRGTTVSVEDAQGGRSNRLVGRGVAEQG